MNRILLTCVTIAGLALASVSSAAVVIDTGIDPVPTNHIDGASISAGQSALLSQALAKNDTAEFHFTALESLRFSEVALSGTDGRRGKALATVRFGTSTPPTVAFSVIAPTGSMTAFAGGSLPGGVLRTGETLIIYFKNGNVGQVPVTASFVTAAVPAPAALPLLAGAVAALGIARRRKTSNKA